MYSIEPISLSHEGPSDISLWRVDLAFHVSLDEDAFSSLSDDERVRARKYLRHEDTLRFATVRVALREQLARRLGIAPHAVRFTHDADRRPRLADSNHVDFNVSHAGSYGLIAMSPVRRVGVDIEHRRAQFDWRSVAPLTLDPAEKAWIEGLEIAQQNVAFYDAWVAKEALVKTTGVGIIEGLQHLTVLPRDASRVILRNRIPHDMRVISAHWLAAPNAYAACLAWSETPFSS
ncbi:4'-phosphopantetheinyl transferase [Paraburkholderia fungorum]|uniref:4'-phosphopantetheinyl transferase n=1 Tax=Paraburkholderia fungorum TaxID=134537 RepID=A0A1H1IU16_9BURK|nr:4'-phosphopantetheinyl transferase superfamily protein [Paraburkholderia fungorum]SDR40758.1 4'-phosphopantetheinyl transferase [Paraburkholderia fungorum]